MGSVRTVLLSKLFLRLVYITAAYSTSHIAGLLASPKVTAFLANCGVDFDITDPMKFKTAITAGMLLFGEVIFHFFHEKFILPHVKDQIAVQPPEVTK